MIDLDDLEYLGLVHAGVLVLVDEEMRASVPVWPPVMKTSGCGCG
jgi:hypothetical protein